MGSRKGKGRNRNRLALSSVSVINWMMWGRCLLLSLSLFSDLWE